MYTAINLVQTFDLKDASDEYLKPAARKLAGAAAKSGDVTKLTQAAHLANSLALKDVIDDTLQPALRKLAAESTQDVGRLAQLVTVAQHLNMKETIDNTLKPEARKALLAAADRLDQGAVNQAIQLARTLELKEGVPLALKTARAKQFNSWTRGTALLFVAEYGGKEHVSELEPLLSDRSSVGTMGINFTTITTDLGDVALAVSVTLSGQSLGDYDFPYVKICGAPPRTLANMSPQCFGFTDAAGRTAAFKKWRERATAKK
jgi:hypothetical protein